MSKYLGAYSIDQQNRILCLGKRAKAEGYDLKLLMIMKSGILR